MLRRNIPLLFFFYAINAQIALPTFQAVHKPQSTSSSSLYDFTSHTFTNCGATGREGPTLANCKSSYDVSWENNTDYFNVPSDAGIQYWTVPETATYTIEVWGADGGNGDSKGSYTSLGGDGRKLKANFSLVQDSVLKILVGQRGGNGTTWYYAGGGGGGTFVTYSNNTPIIVGSGGNGGAWGSWSVDGPDGLFSNVGNTNGGSRHGRGGGGGGLTGDGTNSVYSVSSDKGISFTNGGTGGAKISSGQGVSGDGGFGGGGGALYEGGGGGGYNGGTVVNTNQYNNAYLSYGAGSFSADNASSIVDIGTNDGVGKVVITKN